MKNKSLLLKLGLIVMAVGGFGLSFTSAAATIFNLKFNTEKFTAASTKAITDKMMYVHFADNGNNFGGFLYFSNGSGDADPDNLFKVQANGDPYECRTKLKGFYYNAERGERLWPLDDETWANVLEIEGLTTTGGIYTSCVNTGYQQKLEKCPDSTDPSYAECEANVKKTYKALGFGYYGSLNQKYQGNNFNLTVGVKYNTNGDNKFISIDSSSKLVPSFQNLDNLVSVGFVYDYNGGVGLAGCRFEILAQDSMKRLINEIDGSDWDVSKVFRYDSSDKTVKYAGTAFSSGDIICKPMSIADTLLRILVEGVVGMGEGGNEGNTKFLSLGNTTDTKMQYFGTKTVSNATLKNYAIKKAELLCRGKWNTEKKLDDDVLCWEDGGSAQLGLDLLNGKTLIVKHGDVTVKPFENKNDTRYFDVYLLNGNLIIDESEVHDDSGRFVFDKGGFIFSGSVEEFSGGVHRALCPTEEACNGSYNGGNGVAVGSFLRGNFIVNGNVKGKDDSDLKNKYFIYGKFTTNDSFSSLEKTFSWTCKNWIGSDGNYCPEYDNSSEGSPYQNKSLIVIDQNYGSPLLR